MIQTARIIFPHQLFADINNYQLTAPIYLIEESLYFRQYPFHKQKLMLHRASMQFYKNYLTEKGFNVTYIESGETLAEIGKLIKHLSTNETTTITYTDTVDNWLETNITEAAKAYNIALIKQPTNNFLNSMDEANDYFKNKKTYFQTDFYVAQRKQRNILIEEVKGIKKPIGDKWTFDAENREKYPKNTTPPAPIFPKENEFVKEAKEYVLKHYKNNYGSIEFGFGQHHFYPTTFTEANEWLHQFLKQRFYDFGKYEDALVTKENILHHSVLTPMLNIGLLQPKQIIDAALSYAENHEIPLNSLEGFIRQILGWREFIRIVYESVGSKQRTTNYWGFKRKIPASFYTATTGILPIDITIKKLLNTGYNHHIERLMVLGNFMLLCEFNPDDVHQWFMEMYIDSYDWVMVPNVYGMTQFADGGLMTTKPYISGSNYLMKMSDFTKGSWQEIWDALFWRFMHVHRGFFLKNPRLGMLINTFDKMSEEKRNNHLNVAENYLASLDKQLE